MSFLQSMKYLVISGGGANSIQEIGALVVLNYYFDIVFKTTITQQMVGFGGTSAGAAIAFLLNIGCTIHEIIDFWFSIYRIINDQQWSILNLYENGGVLGDSVIFQIKYKVQNILKGKFNIQNISFEQLYNLTGKELYICASRFTDNNLKGFHYKSTPTVDVTQAILASCCLPFLFSPISIDDELYYDGGVSMNFPVGFYPLDQTLGLWMITRSDIACKRKSNWKHTTNYILQSLLHSQDDIIQHLTVQYHRKQFIKFPTRCTPTNILHLSDMQKYRLFITGAFLTIAHLFVHSDSNHIKLVLPIIMIYIFATTFYEPS